MDPASIVGLVAACSSLTKQCASVIKSLHGLIETYKSAELIILSVATECETIQFAWGRIEIWAQQQLHHVDDFEDIGARLQKSIYCGELVMSALEEELLAIISKSSGSGRGISLTWNNSVLNEHQHRIRGQVAALQLLLQVLSLYDIVSLEDITANACRPRKEDRIEVLSVKESVFSESDESALSIIPSDRSTRYSLDGNRLTVISDDGDIQYIRFSFEDALFTSHVYKRNYRFPAMRTKTQDQDQLKLQRAYSSTRNARSTEKEPVNSGVAQHGDSDDWFFQGGIAQFHNDIFTGDVLEDNTSQSRANAPEFSSSSESIPNTPDLLPIYLLRPTNNIDSSGSANDDTTAGFLNSRDRKRREQDKKIRLSRALQKANTAALLDNAQNFAGAIEAYKCSCIMLGQVIVLSSMEEDKRKLSAIRTTYQNRMEELGRLNTGNEDIVSPGTITGEGEGITRPHTGQAI